MLTTGKDEEGNVITPEQVKNKLQKQVDEYYIYLKELSINSFSAEMILSKGRDPWLYV
jgi:hypothetical protein